MKLNRIKVSKFTLRDDFGVLDFSDVTILYDPNVNVISPESFNQEQDEYFIEDSEVKRLALASAMKFYNRRAKEILRETIPISASEVKGIRDFLGVTDAVLSKILGLAQASSSLIIRGQQTITQEGANTLLSILREEIKGSLV